MELILHSSQHVDAFPIVKPRPSFPFVAEGHVQMLMGEKQTTLKYVVSV